MSLLERYIESDLADLHAEGVRVRVIGRRDGLSDKICRLIDRAESLTANNNRLFCKLPLIMAGAKSLPMPPRVWRAVPPMARLTLSQ